MPLDGVTPERQSLWRFLLPVSIALILLAHATIALLATRNQSLTYDEPAHFRYGRQILHFNSDRFDDSKMPFSAMNALPDELIRAVRPGLLDSVDQPERIGRVVTILFSVLIGLLLFHWARSWYGVAAGIAAVLLYALDPNFLAHAGLVTTDVYAAGMATFAVYFYWGFLRRPGWGTALASAAALAAAQLAKYTNVLLYPIFMCLVAIYVLGGKWRGGTSLRAGRLGRWTGYLVIFAVVNLLVETPASCSTAP